MLNIRRKPGEIVSIGEDIEIIVHRIHRGAVQLGIRAPQAVKIKWPRAGQKKTEGKSSTE